MAPDLRRRVLLLTSLPLEGSVGADTRLALALARGLSGYDFVWFSRRPASGPPLLDTGHPRPVVSRHGMPGRPERLQIALHALLVGRRVDLVHAVMTVGGGFSAVSRQARRVLAGRPVLHTVPGVVSPRALRDVPPLGDVTVASSAYTATLLRTAGFGDVQVVPPGVEMRDWPALPRRAGKPVVLFAGHAGEGEGATEAVDLAARAASRVPLRLVLALRGRPREDLPRQRRALLSRARAAGLDDVEFHGHVASLHPLLSACDAVLLTPRHLAGKADIPLTVLEAMASARPVVISDLPEMAELAGAAVVAPRGDVEQGGRLLAELLSSPSRWDAAARAGRSLVEARYTTRGFLARYAQLYEEVLDTPRGLGRTGGGRPRPPAVRG